MLRLSFVDGKQQPIDLDRLRLTIGRDQGNDVVLDDDRVSGFHAEIQTEGGKSFLVDLGSTNGTLVDGSRISDRRELKAWNRISFGGVEAELVDPDGRRPTTILKSFSEAGSGAVWSLVGVSPPLEGKSFAVAGRTIVGRDKSCELVIPTEMVSRRHAEITPSGEGLTVRDLGSGNGTFVNDSKIDAPTLLRKHDVIRFDEAAFRVVGPEGDADKTKLRPGLDPDETAIRQADSGTRIVPEALSALEGVGHLSGRRFALGGVNLTVGRTPENDIAVDDDTVSASHARLTAVPGGWQVEDVGSSNGTFVNGKKVGSQVLANGDTVRFGMAEFRYEAGGRPGTSQMPSSENETRTSITTAAKKGIPAWAFGLMGFVIVAAGLLAFVHLRKGSPDPMETAKLQGGVVWTQQLGDGRGSPVTPLIADVNKDGMLDVIVADSAGFLQAFDGEQGLKIFDVEAPDRILAPPISAELTGDGVSDLVVAGSTGRVTAFNGKGQVL